MSIAVTDQPEDSRYAARVDETLAGIAAYELSEGLVTFTHTVVEDAYEGQGIGGALARTALDDARRRGLAVVPRCPFIASWIERHPDYAALVREP